MGSFSEAKVLVTDIWIRTSEYVSEMGSIIEFYPMAEILTKKISEPITIKSRCCPGYPLQPLSFTLAIE